MTGCAVPGSDGLLSSNQCLSIAAQTRIVPLQREASGDGKRHWLIGSLTIGKWRFIHQEMEVLYGFISENHRNISGIYHQAI
jgi:hypothetical protein